MTDTVPCVLSDLDHLLAKKELEDGDEIENWFVWELLKGVHSCVFGDDLPYSSLPGRHLLNVLCCCSLREVTWTDFPAVGEHALRTLKQGDKMQIMRKG